MGTERKRIDIVLTERGIFASRSAARAAIMAGLVYINEQRVDKPGTPVREDIEVDVRELPRYVSRGGLKLEKALRTFAVHITGRVALDVGASTGGFTDCLLQHGARKVYSVDVGYGQLDWRLRQDPRVVAMERTNIRNLTGEEFLEPVEFATVDVSFISLALVLPVLKVLGVVEIIALVKPQFEVGKGRVGKKGVVRDPQDHLEVLKKIAQVAKHEGYGLAGADFSPIRGPEGNTEYLFYLKANQDYQLPDLAAVVTDAHRELD